MTRSTELYHLNRGLTGMIRPNIRKTVNFMIRLRPNIKSDYQLVANLKNMERFPRFFFLQIFQTRKGFPRGPISEIHILKNSKILPVRLICYHQAPACVRSMSEYLELGFVQRFFKPFPIFLAPLRAYGPACVARFWQNLSHYHNQLGRFLLFWSFKLFTCTFGVLFLWDQNIL